MSDETEVAIHEVLVRIADSVEVIAKPATAKAEIENLVETHRAELKDTHEGFAEKLEQILDNEYLNPMQRASALRELVSTARTFAERV